MSLKNENDRFCELKVYFEKCQLKMKYFEQFHEKVVISLFHTLGEKAMIIHSCDFFSSNKNSVYLHVGRWNLAISSHALF